jgi:2-polyprenyl-3-methyl-5-hydroxy-6-metoxy-1,4-benzoquinol methylase
MTMTCSCSSVRDAAERQFSQRKAAKDLAQYRAQGPGPTTRLLLDGLAKTGSLHGRLLDIGSGIGALTFELLDRGLTTAVGVDLSSAHVATASKEAARRGRSDSTQFVQGDFLDVASQLSSADIVALDRVVCCYPEYERFLDETLRHAQGYFAFSYPKDLWYVRTWVELENLGRQITRNGFRSFVHPVSAMETAIQRSGFQRLSRGCTRIWCADVYVRSAAAM